MQPPNSKWASTYCCSAPGQINPAKDTQKATYWLCKAALQHNAKAELLLGRLYMGDLNGPGLTGIVAGRVFAKKRSAAVALTWLTLAQRDGAPSAQDWPRWPNSRLVYPRPTR